MSEIDPYPEIEKALRESTGLSSLAFPKEAVKVFEAMEMHVADCWVCRKAENLLQDAVAAEDRIAEEAAARAFCPQMQTLARMLTATITGGRYSGGPTGDQK